MEVLIDEDITIEVLADEGAEVERLLGDMALRLSGSLAAVLAALMLFFRRWQPSILVFTALGLTLAATVAVMAILDIALSMVTVAAVILASGMLVDNSLVVFEHICGAIDVETVADRAARVLVVVLSASLTNVVVFVPVLFLTGPLATLLLPFAATMLIAMASSVVMTILAVPLLYYYLVRPNAGRAGAVRMKRRLNLLPWLRGRRIAVPVLVVATAWLLLALLPGVWATGNFGDASESNSVVVSVRMLEDAQLDETDEIAGRFEDLAFSEIHRAGTTASLQVVTDVHRTRAGVRVLPKRSNEGSLALSAADRATLSAIQTAWTRQMGNYISVDFVLSGPDGRVSGGGGARGVTRFGPADIEFRGYDYQMLKQHVIDFSRHMERIPYLYALDNGFEREERILFGPSFPGFDLYLNQSAMAAAGASTADVLRAVRRFDLSERMAAVFLSGDSGPQRVPVHMLPQGESGFFRMSEILDVRVGPRASLGDIAELHPLDSAMSIERENQQYVHGINYRVRRMQARAVRQTLEGLIDSYELPPGFSIEMRGGWAGGAEATQRTSLGLVALAAAGLVFMVLAGHFESFRRPLLVFATLPLAVVTVVAAYAIVGQGFGLGALLGLILLAGMAVNDAILFLAELGRVERPLAYPLRDDQRPAVAGPAQRLPDDAESTDKHTGTRLGQVREAARGQRLLRLIPTILCAPTNRSAITASIAIRHRIRPILVTSFTTVAALGSSLFVSGAENDLLSVWREFAIVVVLGIVASTAATIFVVPAICALGNTCSSSVAVVAPRSRK
jgi:HAE1 family hydrophobic/amphiphilic exporter-1